MLKMRDAAARIIVFVYAASLAACGARDAARSTPASATGAEGLVVHARVHGHGLEGNRLGDSADRSVHVYLPPGYFARPERRYPVVYLLHGFGVIGGGDAGWLTPGGQWGSPTVAASMDAGIASGRLREMIVVMPDGGNAYGGCFYANSSVGGAWEDFVVHDLVDVVDARFRTVSDSSARALVGHSMGGFGALRLAFAHPDVFGVVYAMSPCCIDDMLVREISPEDFVSAATAQTADELAHRAFWQRAAGAAGAAFTPNVGVGPLFVDLPIVAGPNGPQPVAAIEHVWSNMLATSSIPGRRASLSRLRAIGLEVGDHDEVPSVITTARAMDRALTASRIAHDFSEFDGGHLDHLGERVSTAALPFASRHLAGAAPVQAH